MLDDYSGAKCTPVYGRIEMRSWFELGPDGSTLIGMGQSIHYDEAGKITKVVTEPSGVTLRTE